jgi:signal transduction histidine kinase
MLLLSLALAELIRFEKEQRERAQTMAIEAKSSLLESLKSSEDKLEQTVRERTAQLESSLRHEKELLARYMRFSTLISHEFRNPLSIITSQLSLLRKEHELGQVQLDKRLTVIGSATRRLQLVFDRWLQSDRLGHSLQNITPRPITLQTWLEHLVEANAHCLAEHRIELRCTAGISSVHGDEYLLEIALSNLMENAAKYSAQGSQITLETRTRPGQTGIAVIDRGQGIAPEHQQAVFTEYFRVAPEGAVRGMGLGLSIVQRIVEAHGGQLQLESVPGHGCTFCLWLPEPNRRQHT